MVNVEELQAKAGKIRENIIKMLVEAGSGHSAGSLGSADFWTALYFGGVIKYKPLEPEWKDRDMVLVDAGHYAPVVYATLAEAGFFDKSELFSLRKLGSRLQGHPHKFLMKKGETNMNQLPGIESTSGPLGQGISQAVGVALALRLDNKHNRVICFMSDGAQNEGQVWEGYMLAGKEKLSNLTVVVDRNNIQIDGRTEEVMPLEPLLSKIETFGWSVIEIDGHNFESIIDALADVSSRFDLDKPRVIIMHTVPGKGVGFMENDFSWHGKPPIAPGEAVEAIVDIHRLRTLGGKIISEHE